MDNDALRIGRQQVAKIDAALTRATADYQEAVTSGDEETAGLAMQNYADLAAQKNNLLSAYHQQLAAEQAAQPRQLTREQVNAMNLEDMGPEVRKWWMSQQSKHGFDPNAYDAGVEFARQNPVRR
jgi:hypothetical protein